MTNSVFVEVEFFLLTFCSLILPVSIYGYMMWKKAISRKTVFLFAGTLTVISGINVFLLQRLAKWRSCRRRYLTIKSSHQKFPSHFIFYPQFLQASV